MGAATVIEPALAQWLTGRTGQPGPWTLRRLPGGNSNETCLLTSAGAARHRNHPVHPAPASAARAIRLGAQRGA